LGKFSEEGLGKSSDVLSCEELIEGCALSPAILFEIIVSST
jgi:hypothetical protein